MYCLAGIGGRLSGFIQSANAVDQMVAVDGCDLACARATLEDAGVRLKNHLVVTELGIEKNKDLNLKKDDVDSVKQAVRLSFDQPLSPHVPASNGWRVLLRSIDTP